MLALVIVPDAEQLVGVTEASNIDAFVSCTGRPHNVDICGFERMDPFVNERFPFAGFINLDDLERVNLWPVLEIACQEDSSGIRLT
ncbi:hypothetical protein [Sinorhizobium fredii]|uniref:hypothetical protein n=1 Tax=Rhizobium fredii TaxID=380 RepID=UPI0035191F90